MNILKPQRAVVALSGGMNSSALLLHLLVRGYIVKVVSFDYAQKNDRELNCAGDVIRYFDSVGYENKILKYSVIDLTELAPFIHHPLVTAQEDLSGDFNIPNLQKIFHSVLQSIAISWANEESAEVKIAMGIDNTNAESYPDCGSEFLSLDYSAFLKGNFGGEKVSYYLPFLNMDKYGVLNDAEANCREVEELRLNDIFGDTLTSPKIFWFADRAFSDYKNSKSIERVLSWVRFGRPDPIRYADDSGPVSWEDARDYALKTIEN